MCRFRRSTTFLRLSTILGLAFAVTTPLLTQISGDYAYDADNHAYFVTGDTTVDGDISGKDVLIGKDNATDFDTLANPITVHVTNGAAITDGGFRYPVGNGTDYGGLSAFGGAKIEITGGSSWYASGYDASVININGGEVSGAIWSHHASVANIAGGIVGASNAADNGVVNISGGTVDYTQGFNHSVTNISGGRIKSDIYCNNASVTNLSGGAAGFIHGYDNSAVNITGGTLDTSLGLGDNTTNITGGSVKFIYDFGASTTNISGGNVGGIDNSPNETGIYDPNDTGIYLKSGTLNLFGSDFRLSNVTTGIFARTSGVYATLNGSLLDGTALNTTLFLADSVTYQDLGGGTQDEAIIPSDNGAGASTFHGVPSGGWFDPPLAGAYQFAMTDGSLFTSILDFPANIGDADGKFAVSVGAVLLGVFEPGTSVNFADFGFAEGVPAFTISGIYPLADAANPQAFPVKLAFSSPFASFTIQGIGGAANAPEPSALALFAVLLPFVLKRNRLSDASWGRAMRPAVSDERR